jgi:hypothetical protein
VASTFFGAGPKADKDAAEQQGKADATLSAGMRGIGWVVIDGAPRAKAGGRVNIIGAREGVDGDYYMEEVEHTYAPPTCRETYPHESRA